MTLAFGSTPPTRWRRRWRRWRRTSAPIEDLPLDISLFFAGPVRTRTWWRRFNGQWATWFFNGRREDSILPFNLFDSLAPFFADVIGEADQAGYIFL